MTYQTIWIATFAWWNLVIGGVQGAQLLDWLTLPIAPGNWFFVGCHFFWAAIALLVLAVDRRLL